MANQTELTFIRSPRGMLGELLRLERSMKHMPREEMSPAAAWLRDHMRFLCDSVQEMRMPFRFSSRLPKGERDARILEAVRELCWNHTDILSARAVREHLLSRPEKEDWTGQELAFLPSALRIALMEKVQENVRQCHREVRAYFRAVQFVRQVKHGRLPPVAEDKWLLDKAIHMLAEEENADALKQVDDMLRQKGLSAEQLNRVVREQMTASQQRLSRAILSLQQLQRMDFARLIEKVSPVYRILSENVHFSAMDAQSKGHYAFWAQRLSKEYCVSEMAVARAAVALSQQGQGAEGDCGYYLIHHPELIARYLLVKKRTGFARRHREGLFLCLLYALPLLSILGCVLLKIPFWAAVPVALCLSQLTREGLYPLLRRLFPSRLLPRVKIKTLGETQRTLVVVPTLITGRGHMMQMIRHLRVLACASGSENIDYMLLCDLADADAPELPADEDVLLAAQMSLRALNQQQPGAPFYALIRSRVWQEVQKKYLGWERKRGALNMLNDLIVTGQTEDKIRWANFDVEKLKDRYAYVITLDADTFLPSRAVQRLVGAMEHPLQKGRVAVIQPRMAVGADTLRTRAQWHLGGAGGLDVYGGACQDLYQDMFGKGSFVGKGIYDPYLWRQRLMGKFPNGRLLSHDLIEGEYACCALAEDIVLYDGHPCRLSGFIKRLHRWTRGDWQLMPFLFKGDLSMLSKHKIWDNLRRSLVPLGQMAVLLFSVWLDLPWLALLALPWPLRGLPLRLTLLPAFGFAQLDALVRALWRQFVSHRQLLSWVTAAQLDGDFSQPVSGMLFSIAGGLGMILGALRPGAFWPLVVVGILWTASPLMGLWLDRALPRERPMDDQDKQEARRLAEETWHFFDTFVQENTHFLPPDNVQLSPDKGVAMRTSPTNIGMYLISCLSARELELISGEEMGRRLSQTLDTLEKLPKWQGNPYNWYDLHDLSVLDGHFVSSVDAGNLAVCLLCAAQGARSHLREMLPCHENVPARLDKLFDEMRLDALYDKRENLFYIGMNGESGQPTSTHYDMLGSEARLLSFAAIVKKQVPAAHFFRLSRTMVRAGGGAALLSWGGTMFEYLMPHLLLPLYPGTLLRQGCMHAIRAQMSDCPQRPWGVSESGYADFDAELNYQYRAFGLPILARSGDTSGSVIAPYASVMAMPYFPRAACDNLRRMRDLSWCSPYGLYEAADYTPARVEKMPRLVYSHMAHHQGMILCSVCNALTDFSLVRFLTRIPRVQSQLYLLTEPACSKAKRRHMPPARTEEVPDTFLSREAHPPYPVDGHVMGFQGTSYVINGAGQGVLQRESAPWTRFDDRADMQTGPQTYVLDCTGRQLFRPSEGSTHFETGSVQFTMEKNGLEVVEKRTIAPLTGAFLVHLEIRNTGDRPRDVEVSSFLEIAQNQEMSERGVTVRRVDERVIMVSHAASLLGHMVLGNASELHALGDGAVFMGREGSVMRPQSLMQPPCDRTGWTLCPCFNFRLRLAVPAAGSVRCAFVTCVGSDEAALQTTLSQYVRLQQVEEGFYLAREAAQLTARELHLDPRRQEMYQQLLGAIWFSRQPHQMEKPAFSPDVLLRHGITGDLPLLTLVMRGECDPMLLRHVLRFHEWVRRVGVQMDVALVCDREMSLGRPKLNRIRRLIAASGERTWQACRGGVHVLPLLPGEEAEICALSRLVLMGGVPLQRQLDALRCAPRDGDWPAYQRGETPECENLLDDQGFGGFREDGAYRILTQPPAPWHHVLQGEKFGLVVCEKGLMAAWGGEQETEFLTGMPASAALSLSEELLLVLPQGAYTLTSGLVTYEAGVAVYETKCGDVTAQVEVFVHPDAARSYRRITLRAAQDTRLQVGWQVRFDMGSRPEYTRLESEADRIVAISGVARSRGYAVMSGGAKCHVGDGGVAFFRQSLSLRAREGQTVHCILGCMEAGALPDENEDVSSVLLGVRRHWQEKLSRFRVYTMDERLDRMANLWLPYQAQSGCSGKSEGDELLKLLNAMVFLDTDHLRVQTQILRSAAHPKAGMMLLLAAAWYVQHSGDEAIWQIRIPGTGNSSGGTLLQRCLQIAEQQETGSHGLICTETGESTAQTFLAAAALRMFSSVCPGQEERLLQAENWLKNTQKAWMGKTYLQGWNRNGEPLGDDGHIDLVTQCMAVLSGAPARQARKALEQVWDQLYDGENGMVYLHSPDAEPQTDKEVFTGQDTLAAPLLVHALCLLDEGKRAWEVFRKLLPIGHSDTEETARIYQAEPYVMARYVYAGEQGGRGGESWHASAASGMYLVLIHTLLGFEKRADQVRLRPQKGLEEREVTLVYRYGKGIYHLTADRHATYVTLDGKKQEEGWITLSAEKGTHEGRFPMWTS